MKRTGQFFFFFICIFILTACGKREYREGVEYLKNGDYTAAIEQFEQAVDEQRNVGDSWCGIALAKWEMDDYEGTVEAFEKALENGSEETGVMYDMLGGCKMKLGDYAGAIENYEKGSQREDCIEEMLQEMKFNIIAAYEKLEDWETARAKLAEYVTQYPDDAQAAKEAEFFSTR